MFFPLSVTKCQLIVKETMALVIEINGTVLLPHGAFIPKCTDDGAFELVQCNPSTGFCWCVDEDGAEITHTKTKQGRPDCKRRKFQILRVLLYHYDHFFHYNYYYYYISSCLSRVLNV